MIAIGCDHGGFELKQEILAYLREKGIEYKDFGCDSTASVDYPVYAKKVCKAITDGECEKGILICGTGIGISITANKQKGIRGCAVYRLFLCRGHEASQQRQCAGIRRKSSRAWSGSENCGYVFTYSVFRRGETCQKNPYDGRGLKQGGTKRRRL